MNCNSNEEKSNQWLGKKQDIDEYVKNMFSPLATYKKPDEIFSQIKKSRNNFINLNSIENKSIGHERKIQKELYILKLGGLL